MIKFYLFLFLQGFLPEFGDFNYYFTIDVMNISQFFIGFSTVFMGIMVIVGPIVYQHFCHDKPYQNLFFIGQMIYITNAFLLFFTAMRWNKVLKIPDHIIYVINGSFIEVVERLFTFIPSLIIMSKTIPHGVEATMVSLTFTLIIVC